MAYMAIFSRMHSRWAGLKLGYFNRATNSIGNYLYVGYTCDKSMFAGEDAAIEVDARRRRPRAESRRNTAKAPSPTRGGAAAANGGNGGLGDRGGGDVWTDGAGAFRQPWRGRRLARPAGSMFRHGRNPFRGVRRRERRECVLCDEYAYIRAKRGRRRIGFAGSAGRNPTGARERRIFRGDALLAGEAWPAASPFGAPDRAHMYMWRFLVTACAGSEPSVSVHVAKARIESR